MKKHFLERFLNESIPKMSKRISLRRQNTRR